MSVVIAGGPDTRPAASNRHSGTPGVPRGQPGNDGIAVGTDGWGKRRHSLTTGPPDLKRRRTGTGSGSAALPCGRPSVHTYPVLATSIASASPVDQSVTAPVAMCMAAKRAVAAPGTL